jgi:hypothetical protein
VYSSTLVPAPLLCCCCFLPAQTDHLGSTIINPKHKRKNMAHHDSHRHLSISMFFLSLFTFITVNQQQSRAHTERQRDRERPYFCPFLQLSLHKLLGVSESVCA